MSIVPLLVSLGACFLQAATPSAANELFADPGFVQGFTLTAASHPAPKVEIGTLETWGAPGPPAWRMAQWATRELLEPGRCTVTGVDRWMAENAAKRVVLEGKAKGVVSLWLEVHGDFEYDGHIREAGEAWPHLLIEQRFGAPVKPGDLSSLSFTMEGRIPFCKAAAWTEGKLNPGLHTAQVSAFWTVHNVTKGNRDCGDMIWFGIPFFDARYPIPPGHFALDGGKKDASGKFICMLEGRRFWKGPTGDGDWHSVKADMLALLREALSISQEHGHLLNTRFEDLSIDSFNLGWEVPGPYDAAFEVRGLSMWGTGKAPNDRQ